MNLTEKENLTGVSLLTDTGFARFSVGFAISCKKF